jgi:hypothetical protein
MELTAEQQVEMFRMVSEIYHHLGIDGDRPLSMHHARKIAEINILKLQQRRAKRNNECATVKQ